MGVFASIYRTCFLPKEISRQGYPNFDQHSLAKEEKWQRTICAEAALMNSLYKMNSETEKKFLENDDPQNADAARKLVEKLSAEIGTGSIEDPIPGSTPEQLVNGIKKFFDSLGKKLKFSQWRGWGAGQTQVKGFKKLPSFNWIAKQLKKKHKEVILHIGMYKKTADNHFQRVWGHYVTASGFIKKGLKLKINDPSVRADHEHKVAGGPETICSTEQLKSGSLDSGASSVNAKGYEKLNGINLVNGADFAVIDGAYSFSA